MKVKVRKKAEIQEILEERQEKRDAKNVNQDQWHKHWEKEETVNAKKLKKGGFKRPRVFSFDAEAMDEEFDKQKSERAYTVKKPSSKVYRKE
ncbi:MAG: hypothetical protein ACI9QD_000913 [Thermoproteota archaeon]|jgi:hypothetical protein